MHKIYAYDNPYSRQRIPKKDIKTTRRIKKKYERVRSFEKFLKRKWPGAFNPFRNLLSWGINLYKKRIHYDNLQIFFSLDLLNDKPCLTDLHEAKLNSLCLYDILPKEQLSDFENGIKKFYYKYTKPGGLQRNDFRNFSAMRTKNGTGLYRILDMFLNTTCPLSKYVESVHLFVEELDQAFYVITYSLILSDTATENARKILSTRFPNEYILSSAKKALSAYEKYNFFGANKIEFENFLLGIKHQFFKIVSKYVPSFFFTKGIMPPHLLVVESNGKPKIDLLEFFSFNVHKNEHWQEIEGDYDYKDGIACNLGFMSYNKSFMYDHVIIFDSISKPAYNSLAYGLEGYHVHLGKIFVGEVIIDEVDRLIVKEQTRINKKIKKKILSTQSLLKTRLNTYQNIYLYQRLEKALATSLRNNNDKHWGLDSFKHDYKKYLSVKFPNNGILTHKNTLIQIMDRQIESISNIFDVFDVKLKLFESSSNVRLLRWTFILTIISIVVSLLALLDSVKIIDLATFWSQLFN